MNIPFEFRELNSFRVLALAGSFTEAAQTLGLSQSALSRQILGLEAKMGTQLLSRTTRSFRLTQAGQFWLKKSETILADAENACSHFEETFGDRPSKIEVGVCSTISLAYLPGFFHSFRRFYPEFQVLLRQRGSVELIHWLDRCEVDIAIVPRPNSIPGGVEMIHTFEDCFELIGPKDSPDIAPDCFDEMSLIDIDPETQTGKIVARWKKEKGVKQAPTMVFDNYDLMIHSVSLGLGYALVPRRALAMYSKNAKFKRYGLKDPPTRTLCVLVRSETNRPKVIQCFLDRFLFTS